MKKFSIGLPALALALLLAASAKAADDRLLAGAAADKLSKLWFLPAKPIAFCYSNEQVKQYFASVLSQAHPDLPHLVPFLPVMSPPEPLSVCFDRALTQPPMFQMTVR